MNYRVDWTPRAEDELADLWMNGPDPNALRVAVEQVERQLARNPLGVGESRDLDNRIVIEPPVSLIYWIDHSANVATVVSIGWFGPRPKP